MFTEIHGKALDVLRPFFHDPALESSVRGLSRMTGVSPRWVSKTVEALAEEGILLVEDHPTTKRITTGERFQKVKRVYNLDSIQQSGLVEELEEKLYPDAIILFGSYEKGEDRKGSDIDIAVVNGREREIGLEDFEEELGREISIHFVEDPDSGDENFRNSLANGTVLSGFLKVV